MAVLPAQPHLDHLRRQARDLLRAARAGDTAAAERVLAVSDRLTLAAAQLAVAREYGFASWAKLKTEVRSRSADLAQLADEFCVASIRDWTGRAARMLAARPELADYNIATALVLGDIAKVRRAIDADPGLVIRSDERTGWKALHVVCASQWHQLDPARAEGLVAVARLLLDSGADPNGRAADGSWTPLRCAVAGAAHPAIVQLLLDRGAVPEDDDLYLAGFADGDHDCLRMLLDGAADVLRIARMALAAPISRNDADGVRLLLEAGADPRRYLDDYGADGGADTALPCPVIYAAVRSDCSAEIVDLLLAHGAEPALPGADGRSPHALAVRKGRTDLAVLLRQHGASNDATELDVFLSACLRGDLADAKRLASAPGFPGQFASEQQSEAMIRAAETGNTDAMRVMLDIGFPADVRGEAYGGTALHAAAYAGGAEVVRLLIDRGADIEARDARWESTPVDWACVGSGEQPAGNPRPDWPAAIAALIEAGASLDGITLNPDDPKPPSRAVAGLLRRYGVKDEQR
jgi:ankyrin repeat protein